MRLRTPPPRIRHRGGTRTLVGIRRWVLGEVLSYCLCRWSMSAASRSSSGRRSGGRSERRRFEPAGAAPFLVQNYDSEKSQAKPDNANDNTYWGGKVARLSRTALILIGLFLPSHPSLFTFSLSRRNFGNHRCGKCDCEIESYYRSDDIHPSSPPFWLVFIWHALCFNASLNVRGRCCWAKSVNASSA